MENAGDIVVPAVWSRITGDLANVCRAGRYAINWCSKQFVNAWDAKYQN